MTVNASKELQKAAEPQLKQNIRFFLRQLMDENNVTRQRIINLKNEYLDTSTLGSYHDIIEGLSGRFAHVKDSGSYYVLKLKKNQIDDDIRIEKLHKLYVECTQIIQENILRVSKLSYSFLYKDENGNILNITTDSIPEDMLSLNFSKTGLQISRSAFATQFAAEIEEAKKNQERVYQMTKHYQDLQQTLTQASSQAKTEGIHIKFNEGHIAEAFERDLMERKHGENLLSHRWAPKEAWRLLYLSYGNDPWYSGGDLLSAMYNIQAKSFMTLKETPWSGKVGLTSQNTIEDILNYLVSLIDIDKNNLEAKVNEAYKVFAQRDTNAFDKVAQKLNLTTEQLINKLSTYTKP